MIEITRDWIAMAAPNANAVKNGKNLAESGAFSELGTDKEQTVIFGYCKGSGSALYRCTADFSGEPPVYHCSCPSRQFPCKHCVGLLTAYMLDKSQFSVQEIPEEVTAGREKREAKEAKKERQSSAPKTKKTVLTAAAKKKLEKQQTGLDLAEQFVRETMQKGIAGLLVGNISVYEDLAKEMGNYYLTGVQAVLWEILDFVKQGRDGKDVSAELVAAMVKLQMQIQSCRAYLEEQIREKRMMPKPEIPYELLGNVWKLEQLKELGQSREQVRLLQLSFNVTEDKVQKRYEDIGYYMVLETKEIVKMVNLVPMKAMKHISRDDSVMDVIEAGMLVYYPGGANRRVRCEEIQLKPVEEAHLREARQGARSLSEVIKEVKNQLKNPLGDDCPVMAVSFEHISEGADGVMLTAGNDSIVLRSMDGRRDTVPYIKTYQQLQYRNQTYDVEKSIFVVQFWYDRKENRIFGMPLSLITEGGILRL